ncbi:MAG TPA: GNAT family N-acetyltransferase [Thermomicrobiales bacterium]|nr:GNAT family N-acetyltransferase [Thermomicrobiales bacterium]
MLPDTLVVRPLGEGEDARLSAASWPGGLPERHRDRLARQRRGDVLYLVAWLEDQPAGHLLLLWTGPADEPMASRLARCAEIQDFVVRPDLRSRGVGRRMLTIAEGLARRHGRARLGLNVGLDNPRARAFYERAGFVEAGLGPLPIRWQSRGPDGGLHWHEETAIYLVKALASGRGPGA